MFDGKFKIHATKGDLEEKDYSEFTMFSDDFQDAESVCEEFLADGFRVEISENFGYTTDGEPIYYPVSVRWIHGEK